jgi:hypothetical protein
MRSLAVRSSRLTAALAAGKQVFLASPYDWSFAHHPRCRRFDSIEAAVMAICAMRGGKVARLQRVKTAA